MSGTTDSMTTESVSTHTTGAAAATVGADSPDRVRGNAGQIASVPFTRGLHAELRKMVDTRAGRWLLIVMSAISLLVMIGALIWGPAEQLTVTSFIQFMSLPMLSLLPIIGIMAATAEWTQRTGLVTFTLEPRRGRVVTAKIVAAVVLGLIVTASVFAAAVFGNLIAGVMHDGAGAWDLSGTTALGIILVFAILVLQGTAFGFAVMNTPIAIVAIFLLPTVWTVIGGMVESVGKVQQWVDLSTTTGPLMEGAMAGQDWAKLATSVAVWVLLPLAIGVYRVLNREVK